MPNRNRDIGNMHRKVDWVRPADRTILLELRKYGGYMKPATVTLNIDYSRKTIATRLQVLAAAGLVERKSKNVAGYRITDSGLLFLEDRLTADELESRAPDNDD